MSEYLEEFNNELGQIFAEFSMFLYLVTYDSKKDLMLHNVFMTSQCTCMRTLSDFFADNKKYVDDLIYSDILATSENIDICVNLSDDTRKFINKSTAHLSKSRGTISVSQDEYIEARKMIIYSINRFIRELQSGNIKPEYKQQFTDEKVSKLMKTVINQILKVAVINTQRGEKIYL